MAGSLRKELTQKILDFMTDMDPSGANTERMRTFLNSFETDADYYRYMYDFFKDPNKNWSVAYKPYESGVNMDFIHNLADKHGIPIYEHVYMPYLSPDKSNPIGTVNKIMVLDYPIKRLKQMVYKKSHSSMSTTQRSSETGQVTGADKTARVTDPELYSLIVQNQYEAAREFYSFRADNIKAQNAAQRKIITEGRLSMDDVDTTSYNSVTGDTISKYMMGCALISNMNNDNPYLLKHTTDAGYDERTVERSYNSYE